MTAKTMWRELKMEKSLKSIRGPATTVSRRAVVLSLVAVGAAGCASGGTPKADAKATGTVKASGTVTVWVGSWWVDMVPPIEAQWNKDHPEITLKFEPLPINGYVDKFTASALGGDPPDIIDLDGTIISTVAAQKLLQPLDDLAKQVDVKDYAPGIWSYSQYKGVQYALPNRASSDAFYYNKTLFDQAGIAYPTDAWTYADMLDMAKKLTISGQYGVGLAADVSDPANAMDLLSGIIWANGGEFMNNDNTKSTINSPKAVEGLTFWSDLYTKYKVSPAGTPNFTTSRDVLPLFEANKIGIFTTSSNALAEFAKHPELKFGLVLSPGKVNRAGGWTMGIPVGAKNPDAARVFLLWFSDPKRMGTLMNRTPARISANAIAPWNDAQYAVFSEALKDSKALPQVANFSEMQNIIITEAQKILVGQKTPQEAADAMAKQIDPILAKNK